MSGVSPLTPLFWPLQIIFGKEYKAGIAILCLERCGACLTVLVLCDLVSLVSGYCKMALLTLHESGWKGIHLFILFPLNIHIVVIHCGSLSISSAIQFKGERDRRQLIIKNIHWHALKFHIHITFRRPELCKTCNVITSVCCFVWNQQKGSSEWVTEIMFSTCMQSFKYHFEKWPSRTHEVKGTLTLNILS